MSGLRAVRMKNDGEIINGRNCIIKINKTHFHMQRVSRTPARRTPFLAEACVHLHTFKLFTKFFVYLLSCARVCFRGCPRSSNNTENQKLPQKEKTEPE